MKRVWRFFIKSTSDGEGFWYTASGFTLAQAWPTLSVNEYVSQYEETNAVCWEARS